MVETAQFEAGRKVASDSSAYLIYEHVMGENLKRKLLNWKNGRSAKRIRELGELGHLSVLEFSAHSLSQDKLYDLVAHRMEETKFVTGKLFGDLDCPELDINIPCDGRYVFAIGKSGFKDGKIFVPRTNRHILLDLFEGYEDSRSVSHGTDLVVYASPEYARALGLSR